MTLEFRRELAALINKHGLDTKVGAPDFLLADLLGNLLNEIFELNRRFKSWRERPSKT